MPIYKVIFDRRHRESVQFAGRAAVLGLATAAIEGDVTHVWYADVDPEWRRQPTAIAGLTEHGPLFCFEQLARASGLRVVFRAEHRPADRGGLAHALSGPKGMLDVCAALDIADTRWPEIVADAVASCPMGRWQIDTATTATSFADATVAERRACLYSWVIAPAVRA